MKMSDKLLNVLEKNFFNVLVFHYEKLGFMFASSESMHLFDIKDNNISFYDLFPHVDIDKIRNNLESSKTGFVIAPVVDDYTAEFSKINLNGTNLLILSLMTINEKDILLNYDALDNKVAKAVLDDAFSIIEVDSVYECLFGSATGRPFNFNFVGSHDNDMKLGIIKALQEKGAWHGGLAMENTMKHYNLYFVIITKVEKSNNVMYDFHCYPYQTYHGTIKYSKFVFSENPYLYDRQLFLNIVTKKLLELKPTEKGYLVFLDINNFKNVNDIHGHLIGDQTIAEIGKIITTVFEGDAATLYGGDEFALYLSGQINVTDVIDKLKKVEHLIQISVKYKPENTKFIISAGISRTSKEITNILNLIIEADMQMYRAKQGNKLYEYSFK